MSNIALISDLHFGAKISSEKFLNIQKDFFDKLLIPTLESKKVSHLFILGDLLDNPININVLVKNTILNIFNKIITSLPNIKIIILIGNHEIYYKNTLETTSIKLFEHFPNVEIVKNIKEYTIDNKSILCVPWLIKDTYIHNEFDKIIESNKKFDYCFGHFSINNFEVVPSVIEDKGLSIDTFSSFSQVYSGHFHIRNKLKNIQYLGCPYEITWNDFGNIKGITILDVENMVPSFIENTISPRHIKLKLSSIAKDKTLLKNVKNNFVKFYYDIIFDPVKKLNFEDKLKTIGAFDLEIIDETIGLTSTEDISVDEDIQGSPIDFLFSLFNEIKHPENINVSDLKIMTQSLYEECLKE